MGQMIERTDRWTSAHPLEDLPQDVVTLSKSYKDGHISDWHRHRRWQLIHAVEGLMVVETADDRWTVPSGYGLIVPGDLPHATRMIGRVELRTLYVTPSAFAAHPPPLGVVVRLSPLLALVIERLCAYANEAAGRPDFNPLCELAVHEMTTAAPCPLALPFPHEPRLAALCRALIADPGAETSIEFCAAEAGMSRRTFTRTFVAQTGLSFGDWTRRLRCQAALEAEQQGEPSERTAARLGYASKYALRAMMERLLS